MFRLFINAYHLWLSNVYRAEYLKQLTNNYDAALSLRILADKHAKLLK